MTTEQNQDRIGSPLPKKNIMPLYRVRVEFEYWAETDTASEARHLAVDAASVASLFDDADADEITDMKYAPNDKDTLGTLVYGPDDDVTVADVLHRQFIQPRVVDPPRLLGQSVRAGSSP